MGVFAALLTLCLLHEGIVIAMMAVVVTLLVLVRNIHLSLSPTHISLSIQMKRDADNRLKLYRQIGSMASRLQDRAGRRGQTMEYLAHVICGKLWLVLGQRIADSQKKVLFFFFTSPRALSLFHTHTHTHHLSHPEFFL